MHDETSGGQGDGFRFSRADFALMRRAARERWGVPDPLRTEALYQAAKTLADPEASHRDRLAASKLLLEADKLDLEQDRFDHQTKPPDTPADDFELDLAPDDPPQQADRPPA